MMNKEQITGLVRHLLTFGGGMLAAKGKLSIDDVNTIASSVATLLGILWSVKSNTPIQAPQSPVNSNPPAKS